ncbi:glycerophosphodiester phosphodiesterase family protein [Desulforhopalus sp. 52FAK]
MKTSCRFIFSIFFIIISFAPASTKAETKITILKDGGGAELIENSLVSITVAVTDGADFIELPVNLSSDDQLIVYRDTTLNRLTDVADLFPDRNREDGNYYTVDFSLLELRQLRLSNVFENDQSALSLGISTLEEILNVIQTLNHRFQKNSGAVISLVQPGFYNKEGKDVSLQLKNSLERLSFNPADKLYIESSNPDELQKISRWSRGENSSKYALIQAIKLEPSVNQDFLKTTPRRIQNSWLFTNSGLRILASYANAVSLSEDILDGGDIDIQSFAKSLHNYDIKLLSRDSHNMSRRDDITRADFDGLYVDSLQQAAPEEIPAAEVLQTSQVEENGSSLPPFFSNLGLSQPKPTSDPTSNPTDFDNDFNGEEVE